MIKKLRSALLGGVGLCAIGVAGCTTTGPDLPAQTMISSYQALEQTGEVRLDATAPGFVPGADYEPLTPKVIASLDATTEGYPEIMALLEGILAEIVAVGPRPDLQPRIALRPAPSANALAEREDLIVLTTGLISAVMCDDNLERDGGCVALSDEQRIDAIAFVLAHEYAHTLLGHPHQYSEREESLIVRDDIATALAAATTAASIATQLGADVQEEYQDIAGGLSAALVASPVIEGELYRGAFAPFARQAESDADFLAVDMLQRTNGKYDAFTGAEYLRALYPAYNSVVEERLTAAMEASAERAKLHAAEFASQAPAALMNDQAEGLMRSLRARLMSEGIQLGLDLYERFSQRDDVHLHFAGEARADAVADYGANFNYVREMAALDLSAFGLTESEIAQTEAERSRLGAELRETWEEESGPLRAAQRARELMALGDLDGARAELDQVRDGSGNTEYLMARGQLEMASGAYLRASEYFLDATRRNDAPIGAWAGLAKGRYERGQVERALGTLDSGEARFGEDSLLVERIEILLVTDPEAADEALARCPQAYAEQPRKLRQCEALAPEEPAAETESDSERNGRGFGLPASLPWGGD